MPKTAADPNLLFGAIAVQMHFISRDDLNAALAEVAGDPSRSLAQVLRDRQALTADSAAVVETVLREHLGLQRDSAGASLSSEETLAPTAVSPAAAAFDLSGVTLPPQSSAAPGSLTPVAS